MTPDWPKLLASIQRCNAVYETDDALARAAFVSLGCTVLGRLDTPKAQAIVHIAPDGVPTLTIAGTRFSEGPLVDRIDDVWEDAEEVLTDDSLGGGAIVASGAYTRGNLVWAWAQPLLPPNMQIRVEGHSLGGQTTHVLHAIIPPGLIGEGYAWEPPKAGNDAFWAQYGTTPMVTVVNGFDPWAGHPWVSQSLRHPPGPILWLHDGTWSEVTRETWPGPQALHASDHDTDQVMRAVIAAAAR